MFRFSFRYTLLSCKVIHEILSSGYGIGDVFNNHMYACLTQNCFLLGEMTLDYFGSSLDFVLQLFTCYFKLMYKTLLVRTKVRSCLNKFTDKSLFF